MRRPLLLALAVASLAVQSPAWAEEGGEGGKKKDSLLILESVGSHNLVLELPAGISEPISGVSLNITQFSYPGVPDRASCRTVIKVENDSTHKVSFYSLVRTFDNEKQPISTWMTPSGELAPGQAQERLYSCKLARFMVLDRASAGGWPNICEVDGEERNPCPIQLTFDSNIDFLPAAAAKADDKKSEPKGH